MRPFVNFHILRPREHLVASVEGTGKRLLSRVHPDMIHQLVFRLEELPLP